MTDALLPCPFCGESLLVEAVFCDPYYAVLCRGCENSTAYQEREKSITAWNRRTPSPKLELTQEVREALAAVKEHGWKQYPVGADRAALCHAAIILDAFIRRIAGEEKRG